MAIRKFQGVRDLRRPHKKHQYPHQLETVLLKLSVCTLVNSDGSGVKAGHRETLSGHRLSALKLQVLKSWKYLLVKDVYTKCYQFRSRSFVGFLEDLKTTAWSRKKEVNWCEALQLVPMVMLRTGSLPVVGWGQWPSGTSQWCYWEHSFILKIMNVTQSSLGICGRLVPKSRDVQVPCIKLPRIAGSCICGFHRWVFVDG